MSELTLVLGRIEEFSERVKQKLEEDNLNTKRDIVRALIKRIEIGRNDVNIVFRVEPYMAPIDNNLNFEDCRRRVCAN